MAALRVLELTERNGVSGGAREAPQMHEQIVVIVLLWLALQIPLGSFVGDCIKFGMGTNTSSRIIAPMSSLPIRQLDLACCSGG